MLALDPCSGSIVVTDPNSGAVKAMTSYPSYDNNQLTNSIDADYYAKITSDKTTPMYSRATMQQTAPGSTFKMITAFAAMNEGAIGINDVIQTKDILIKQKHLRNAGFIHQHMERSVYLRQSKNPVTISSMNWVTVWQHKIPEPIAISLV